MKDPLTHAAIYRRLTALYPARFRDEYRPDLVALFEAQLRDEPLSAYGFVLSGILLSRFPRNNWRFERIALRATSSPLCSRSRPPLSALLL